MAKAKPANASPTKSILLDALTADIDLADAVLDLIDNSIDGVRRVAKNLQKWDQFSIKVSFDKKHFTIVDNCGGIEAVQARDYAFRFGRPADLPPEQGLVGMYGVGMKRAIFKMGNHFYIKSTTSNSSFDIEEDLKPWRANEKVWKFDFDSYDDCSEQPPNEIGTSLKVSQLFDGISEAFANPQFEAELIKKAAKAHRTAIEKDIRIVVNNTSLKAAGFTLLGSKEIASGYATYKLNGASEPVNVELYAGISDSEPKEAGWSIFCNGRMVLEADKTARTVWGEQGIVSIPKIHNQFARFRGFAFFECDDQKRLPWTSTKSGINQSSEVYQKAKLQMMDATRPVISFLNELDSEKSLDLQPRHEAVKRAKPVSLVDIVPQSGGGSHFKYTGDTDAGPEMARISYQRAKKQVDKAKLVLGVESSREVGEETFNYWYRYEIGRK